MKCLQIAGIALALTTGFGTVTAQADEFRGPLEDLAKGELAGIAAHEAVIKAVIAQNEAHKGMDQARIDALDSEWRGQVQGGGALIDGLLANELSAHLSAVQEGSHGLYTEVFVMDNHGLNVGQSAVTSDYWQGDEAKWQTPFNENQTHFGEVELDESTQSYQAQVSLPVRDASGQTIGAVTFGINVEMLLN